MIAFDNHVGLSFAGGAGPTYTTGSLTVTATNPVLVAFIQAGSTAPNSVKWAGTAMTLVGHSSFSINVYGYILQAPVSGANTLVVDFTTAGGFILGRVDVMSFSGAVQTSPLGSSTTHGGSASGTTATTKLNTKYTSSFLVEMICDNSSSTAPIPASGQTTTFSGTENAAGTSVGYREANTAGSQNANWTVNFSNDSCDQVVFEIIPSRSSVLTNNLRPHAFSPGLAR